MALPGRFHHHHQKDMKAAEDTDETAITVQPAAGTDGTGHSKGKTSQPIRKESYLDVQDEEESFVDFSDLHLDVHARLEATKLYNELAPVKLFVTQVAFQLPLMFIFILVRDAAALHDKSLKNDLVFICGTIIWIGLAITSIGAFIKSSVFYFKLYSLKVTFEDAINFIMELKSLSTVTTIVSISTSCSIALYLIVLNSIGGSILVDNRAGIVLLLLSSIGFALIENSFNDKVIVPILERCDNAFIEESYRILHKYVSKAQTNPAGDRNHKKVLQLGRRDPVWIGLDVRRSYRNLLLCVDSKEFKISFPYGSIKPHPLDKAELQNHSFFSDDPARRSVEAYKLLSRSASDVRISFIVSLCFNIAFIIFVCIYKP